MKRGQVIALGLAGVSGLMAIVLANSLMRPAAPPPKPVEKVEQSQVLVARADIGLGTAASESSFRWQDWPKEAVARGFITRQARPQAISDLIGSVARAQIFAGEPVNDSKLVRVGTGGVLAALLSKGMRAISIKIRDETVAGRLILPNDHVDVLSVRKTAKKDEEAGPETVLKNVRVLAIGQVIESRDGKRLLDGSTATLELSPENAEVLALASVQGDIVLTLRSIADTAPDPVVETSEAPEQPDIKRDKDIVRVIRYGIRSRTSSVN